MRDSRCIRRRLLATTAALLLLLAAAFLLLPSPLRAPAGDARERRRAELKFVPVAEGFEMLDQRRVAGLSPVHERFRREEAFEEDAIYTMGAHEGGGGVPPPESAAFKITVAKCALSVDEAVFGALSAALSIQAATKSCVNMSAAKRLVCGADISSVLSNFGWMTSYAFYAPAFCGFMDLVVSWCGGDMAWFFANAGSMTSDALGAAAECQNKHDHDLGPLDVPHRRLLDVRDPSHRRLLDVLDPSDQVLEELRATLAELEEGKRRLSVGNHGRAHYAVECGFHVHDAAIVIVNFVFNAWSTRKVCKSLEPDSPSSIRGLCAAGVIGMVNFGMAMTSISSTLAATCPVNGSAIAFCVSDVTGMASTLLSYGSWGGTIQHDCEGLVSPHGEDSH
eukprot:TRINITY_DN15907_c0_g1_i1.p1 TRINITY_DN15907_c0_g1~~TRINITY_DN15907_c0_g1_i1.p1  ORF type:complete len:393 (+),score=51.21 TRINITY_DN15907_c0_g1_i1:112-1290(+)